MIKSFITAKLEQVPCLSVKTLWTLFPFLGGNLVWFIFNGCFTESQIFLANKFDHEQTVFWPGIPQTSPTMFWPGIPLHLWYILGHNVIISWYEREITTNKPMLSLSSLTDSTPALWKHGDSNILKLSPPKNWKFSDKNSDIVHISAQNIDCGYSLEPPRRGGSNEYPQSMFLKKKIHTPISPSFTI